MNPMKKYCESLTEYRRFPTTEVKIGNVPVGGNNPIRIQSMTTTDTMDTIATVEQSIRMIDVGCEYVRITAPSKKDAENLQHIKNELKKRGYDVPLIADIHFTPNAAEVAATIIEKVRVNPGNYIDRKKFQITEYTDKQYNEEIEKIRERFSPLVKICKEHGTAMRIGANHGSLSDRIMSRYGDTPLGMVESAMEFVRICEDLDYYDIVLSMKASNPQVMVQAYRLLTATLIEHGRRYPIHLGVTEAGGGEDGRIKSAMGIGALLEDGIGDTIRVSLTEPPENEVPVAIALAERYKYRINHAPIPEVENLPINPFEYTKRETSERLKIGSKHETKVIMDASVKGIQSPNDFSQYGYSYNESNDKWEIADHVADFLYLGKQLYDGTVPTGLKLVYDADVYESVTNKMQSFPLYSIAEYLKADTSVSMFCFVSLRLKDLTEEILEKLKTDTKAILVLETENENGLAEQRRAFFTLISENIDIPVVLKRTYSAEIPFDSVMLYSATDFGGLLLDGFGDAIWIDTKNPQINPADLLRIQYSLLQAARLRITRTDYIACPSCGRTLFDLEETTEKVRAKTSHLKGVKIAIMGCIVNGPGEMADADYGYVGSGPGKITLYRGKEIVKKGVDAKEAVDRLIDLIKEDGKWIEKK